MKNQIVKQNDRKRDDKTDVGLEYRLITTDKPSCDHFDGQTVFSVLILQIEDGVTTEHSFLYDVSRDKHEAVRILNLVRSRGISPSMAFDAIENYL